jgi:hypothetical protein
VGAAARARRNADNKVNAVDSPRAAASVPACLGVGSGLRQDPHRPPPIRRAPCEGIKTEPAEQKFQPENRESMHAGYPCARPDRAADRRSYPAADDASASRPRTLYPHSPITAAPSEGFGEPLCQGIKIATAEQMFFLKSQRAHTPLSGQLRRDERYRQATPFKGVKFGSRCGVKFGSRLTLWVSPCGAGICHHGGKWPIL